MSSQSSSSNITTRLSTDDFIVPGSASRLIKDVPRPRDAVSMEKLKVGPAEQCTVSLGSFSEDRPPKGFMVEIDPDPYPAGTTVTEVTSMGSSKRYSLQMHIANFGSKAVNAEIWRL